MTMEGDERLRMQVDRAVEAIASLLEPDKEDFVVVMTRRGPGTLHVQFGSDLEQADALRLIDMVYTGKVMEVMVQLHKRLKVEAEAKYNQAKRPTGAAGLLFDLRMHAEVNHEMAKGFEKAGIMAMATMHRTIAGVMEHLAARAADPEGKLRAEEKKQTESNN